MGKKAPKHLGVVSGVEKQTKKLEIKLLKTWYEVPNYPIVN